MGTGLALAGGAALAFTAFDVARKRIGTDSHPLVVTSWLQLVSLPLFAAWLAVMGFHFRPGWWLPGLGSVALQASANALFIIALQIGPLSRTVPFLSMTPVLSTLGAWLLLGEMPTSWGTAGLLLVTLGAFGLAVDRTSGGFRFHPASLLAVLVAALWSASTVVDKRALEFANPATHATLVTVGVGWVWALERSLRAGPKALWLEGPVRKQILFAGVAGSAAFGLQLLALSYLPVGTVEAIKRTVGGAASLILGRWIFEESIRPRSVFAVILMSGGILLVLLR